MEDNPSSPRWSTTTKLVVALTFVAIFIWLFIQFRNLVGPLLAAFLLAYLVQPAADRLHRNVRIPWRFAVSIMYVLIVLVILGLLAWGGLNLVYQVQNLIGFLQNAVNDLPRIISDIATHVYAFGPFQIDFTRLDLATVSNDILGVVQPLLTRLGNVVGTFASSAVTTLGWFLFMLLISYFILSETGGRSNKIIYIHIPGYEEDLARMGWELNRIWKSFLRGQFIIITMTLCLYTVLLGALGVKYYFGLALVACMARFIPYVGPLIAWITYGLVSYFQGVSLFGMPQLTYALMVVGIAWVTDNIIDSLVTPRIMADALSIHPAMVMVAALIGVNLLGIVGVVLAAPVIASLKLIMSYAIRKLSDRDPWEGIKVVTPTNRPPVFSFAGGVRALASWFRHAASSVSAWVRQKLEAMKTIKNSKTPHID